MANSTAQAVPRPLAIDIGGSGLKLMALGPRVEPLNARDRRRTPRPAVPGVVLAVLDSMVRVQPEFDRVAVGFPRVVRDWIAMTAVNLHPGVPVSRSGSGFWWHHSSFGRR